MLKWYTDITNDNFDYLDEYCLRAVNPDFPGTGNKCTKNHKGGYCFLTILL